MKTLCPQVPLDGMGEVTSLPARGKGEGEGKGEVAMSDLCRSAKCSSPWGKEGLCGNFPLMCPPAPPSGKGPSRHFARASASRRAWVRYPFPILLPDLSIGDSRGDQRWSYPFFIFIPRLPMGDPWSTGKIAILPQVVPQDCKPVVANSGVLHPCSVLWYPQMAWVIYTLRALCGMVGEALWLD